MNYPYYLEFLDAQLRKREKNKEASILQRNLFVAMTSSEMLALVLLLSIFHLSVCIPFRWLSGKTHELREYNWGPMSMGRAIDRLKDKMMELSKHPDKVESEHFMMSFFEDLQNELPPLKEYYDEM